MMRLARLDPSGTAVELYPARPADFAEVYPGVVFGDYLTEETAAAFERMAAVLETPRPEAAYGDTVGEGPPARGEDGIWRQVWVLTPPDAAELERIRTALKERAAAVGERRQPRLTPADLLRFHEVERIGRDARPSPPGQDYPLLEAARRRGAATLREEATAAALRRDALAVQAAVAEDDLLAALAAIDAAATAPEMKAAFDAYLGDDA